MPYKNPADELKNKRRFYQENREAIRLYQNTHQQRSRLEDPEGCRVRKAVIQARYAARHPERYRAQRKRIAYKRDNQGAELIRAVKDTPCQDCGNRFPSYVMDFDHVRGVKKFGVAQMRSRPLDAIIEEMLKCDVVCANCHRIRTWNRRHPEDLLTFTKVAPRGADNDVE